MGRRDKAKPKCDTPTPAMRAGVAFASGCPECGSVAGCTNAPMDPLELFSILPRYNPYLDLTSFARFALAAERLGIFTIGGGVPRNWAQEVGPFVDIVNHRLKVGLTPPRYRYGVRICPEPVHWGGLSGCTYSEGVSWGKFVPPAEGGRFAEVYADATTVWPLLVKSLLEELGAKQAAKRSAARKPRTRRPGRGR